MLVGDMKSERRGWVCVRSRTVQNHCTRGAWWDNRATRHRLSLRYQFHTPQVDVGEREKLLEHLREVKDVNISSHWVTRAVRLLIDIDRWVIGIRGDHIEPVEYDGEAKPPSCLCNQKCLSKLISARSLTENILDGHGKAIVIREGKAHGCTSAGS